MSHFNEVANEWDSKEKIGMMKTLASQVKENIPLSDKLKIMDFGCGTGLFGFEFSNYANELIGVDTSEGMLEVFDKKTKGKTGFRSININLEEKDIRETFDLIVSSMAFHHLNDPFKVLKKLRSCLNKQGKIVIVDLDKEDGSFHPDNEAMGVKHFAFAS